MDILNRLVALFFASQKQVVFHSHIKANKIEYHHIDPQYMGGSPTGKKVPLVGSYHQMITNEF